MKSKFIITTTIIIFLVQLLAFSFTFSVSALESGTSDPISASIEIHPNGNSDVGVETAAMNIFPSNDIPTDTKVMMDLYSTSSASGYSYYLGYNGYFTGYAQQSWGWVHVNYGVSSFKEFNTVKLSCNVFAGDFLGYDGTEYFRLMFNDDEVTEGYTIRYNLSEPIETESFIGTYMKYRRLNIVVYFDKPYLYDSLKVDLFVKTYLPPTGVATRYLLGFNRLQFEKMSAEDFASDTAAGINNLNNKLDNTNDKLDGIEGSLEESNEQLGIIGDTMDAIKNLLSDGLDEEQAQKIVENQAELKENSIKLETNRQHIAEVDKQLESFFDTYEDIEYELFGDSYMNYVDDYVDPVFENQGFIGFWNGLWSHPFVMGMIIVSLTFCAVGFAMYGVR